MSLPAVVHSPIPAEVRVESGSQHDAVLSSFGFVLPPKIGVRETSGGSLQHSDSLGDLPVPQTSVDVEFHTEYLNHLDQKDVQYAFGGIISLLQFDRALFARLPKSGIHIVPVESDSSIFDCMRRYVGIESHHPIFKIVKDNENEPSVTLSLHFADGAYDHWIFLKPPFYKNIADPSMGPLSFATILLDQELQRVVMRNDRMQFAVSTGESEEAMRRACLGVSNIIQLCRRAGVESNNAEAIRALEKAVEGVRKPAARQP